MAPDEPNVEAFVAEVTKKPEPPKLNRAQKRQLAKDLRREHVRAMMSDMAIDLRAKRRSKRRESAKVRNLNRRLSK